MAAEGLTQSSFANLIYREELKKKFKAIFRIFSKRPDPVVERCHFFIDLRDLKDVERTFRSDMQNLERIQVLLADLARVGSPEDLRGLRGTDQPGTDLRNHYQIEGRWHTRGATQNGRTAYVYE